MVEDCHTLLLARYTAEASQRGQLDRIRQAPDRPESQLVSDRRTVSPRRDSRANCFPVRFYARYRCREAAETYRPARLRENGRSACRAAAGDRGPQLAFAGKGRHLGACPLAIRGFGDRSAAAEFWRAVRRGSWTLMGLNRRLGRSGRPRTRAGAGGLPVAPWQRARSAESGNSAASSPRSVRSRAPH